MTKLYGALFVTLMFSNSAYPMYKLAPKLADRATARTRTFLADQAAKRLAKLDEKSIRYVDFAARRPVSTTTIAAARALNKVPGWGITGVWAAEKFKGNGRSFPQLYGALYGTGKDWIIKEWARRQGKINAIP